MNTTSRICKRFLALCLVCLVQTNPLQAQTFESTRGFYVQTAPVIQTHKTQWSSDSRIKYASWPSFMVGLGYTFKIRDRLGLDLSGTMTRLADKTSVKYEIDGQPCNGYSKFDHVIFRLHIAPQLFTKLSDNLVLANSVSFSFANLINSTLGIGGSLDSVQSIGYRSTTTTVAGFKPFAGLGVGVHYFQKLHWYFGLHYEQGFATLTEVYTELLNGNSKTTLSSSSKGSHLEFIARLYLGRAKTEH